MPGNPSTWLPEDPGVREAAYYRIADDLRRKIMTGVLVPGDRLPSRRELAREYGLASDRPPEMAVRLLAAEGLVQSRPGAGIFVAAPPVLRELARVWDDPASPTPSGTTRVTEKVTGRGASHLEAESLGIPPGSPVLVITRRYWIGDKQASEAVAVLAGSREAVIYVLPRP